MRNKQLKSIYTLLLLTLCCSFAGGQPTRVITDMGGRRVTVPKIIKRVYIDKHCAMMVNAIAPELTVNVAFNPSNEAKQLLSPAIWKGKPYTQGSAEEILKLHPDIVFMSDELSPSVVDKANKMQAQLKLPVVLLEMNMEGYKPNLAFLGNLFGKQQKAAELIGFIKTYLDVIEKRAKQIPRNARRQVYYAEGPNGLSTDPSGSKHSQIIDFVGATNIAKAEIIPGKGMSVVSMEQVMVWNPEVILVWTGSAENLVTYKYIHSDPLWANIRAVKNKLVYQIPWLPYGWFDRPPGTNRILGTIWTANLLYPAIFKYDMVKVTQEYFRKFYHVNLSVAKAKALIISKPKM
ncbi:MAG: iron(III) transporter periplasmic iron-binding protein [Bacteroidetes bacterium]|nr:iron(III) transporter periplasmic iron-binding protein [Bacteroidota bacterium]